MPGWECGGVSKGIGSWFFNESSLFFEVYKDAVLSLGSQNSSKLFLSVNGC